MFISTFLVMIPPMAKAEEGYAELTPGQCTWLTFALQNPEPETTTTLIFYTEGHYNTIT